MIQLTLDEVFDEMDWEEKKTVEYEQIINRVKKLRPDLEVVAVWVPRPECMLDTPEVYATFGDKFQRYVFRTNGSFSDQGKPDNEKHLDWLIKNGWIDLR